MNEKIVVTGMGAVTPIGNNVETYWKNLTGGVCGIDRISHFDPSDLPVQIAAEVKDFDPKDYMPRKLAAQTDLFSQFAYVAAKEVLGEPGESLPADPDRIGLTLGTAMGGIAPTADAQEALTKADHKLVSPRLVPRILGNMAAAQISIAYGLHGPSMTLQTACASGGDAVAQGADMILLGDADVVLAVGAESILCPLVTYSLASARALSHKNDDPEHASMPFDKGRSGFVMGEGGGALLLETEAHARARGAKIYAELVGWGNTNDGYHVTKPCPDGTQAAACMRKALKKAKMQPEEIGYINAHGTATPAGDTAEVHAILDVFGSASPKVGSTKGATGHMMGAGGITESIACIKAIETGILPPTLHLTTPESDLNFVMGRSEEVSITAAMSNAFGFGGQNSSLIFRKV